jgi:hypothetical protein
VREGRTLRPVDVSEWMLRWPRATFAAELQAVRLGGGDLDLLLTEAFGSDLPRQARQQQPMPSLFEPLLEAAIPSLPEQPVERPLYSQRRGGPQGPARISVDAVTRQFVHLIDQWFNDGYFDLDLPRGCVDDDTTTPIEPGHVLEMATGQQNLWPLGRSRSDWSQDDFLDLVEVFHRLIARPRQRSWHSWNNCGWHTSLHSRTTGQQLYRYEVNRLLTRSEMPYRIATGGADTGLIVRAESDDLSELVHQVTHSAGDAADEKRHAISLFRSRHASRQDRRSAVVALANILEDRRALLKAELLSKDEGALFLIANQFAIRHQNALQMSEYEDEYLDWIFWWYLATVELTDKLLARRSDT